MKTNNYYIRHYNEIVPYNFDLISQDYDLVSQNNFENVSYNNYEILSHYFKIILIYFTAGNGLPK